MLLVRRKRGWLTNWQELSGHEWYWRVRQTQSQGKSGGYFCLLLMFKSDASASLWGLLRQMLVLHFLWLNIFEEGQGRIFESLSHSLHFSKSDLLIVLTLIILFTIVRSFWLVMYSTPLKVLQIMLISGNKEYLSLGFGLSRRSSTNEKPSNSSILNRSFLINS